MYTQQVAVTVYGVDAATRLAMTKLSGITQNKTRVVTPKFALKDTSPKEWEYEVSGLVLGEDWLLFTSVLTHTVVSSNLISVSTHVENDGVRKIG